MRIMPLPQDYCENREVKGLAPCTLKGSPNPSVLAPWGSSQPGIRQATPWHSGRSAVNVGFRACTLAEVSAPQTEPGAGAEHEQPSLPPRLRFPFPCQWEPGSQALCGAPCSLAAKYLSRHPVPLRPRLRGEQGWERALGAGQGSAHSCVSWL